MRRLLAALALLLLAACSGAVALPERRPPCGTVS